MNCNLFYNSLFTVYNSLFGPNFVYNYFQSLFKDNYLLFGPNCNMLNIHYSQEQFHLPPSQVDKEGSWEAINKIWFRYSKDLSRYMPLVPSSLLFDTPLRHVVLSQYQTKRGSLLSQVDYYRSKATAHRIWTKYSHNFYFSGTTLIHVLSFNYSKFQNTIRPPFAFHSIT